MIFSRDYSRAILTLRQDDGRFSADRRGIYGRAVVEVRGGRAKIMLYAQGIKNGCICSLYIVCRRNDRFIPMKAVLVNIKNGRAEVKWDFNPDNILGSGMKLEDAKVLAVMTDSGESVLSAYFDKPVKWRTEKTSPVRASAAEEAEEPAKETAEEPAEAAEKPDREEKTAEAAEEPDKEEKPEETTDEPCETEISADEEKPTEEPSVGEDAGRTSAGNIDFTEVVNLFRKDLDELRKYAYMQRPVQEEKTVCRHKFDIDHIFEERERIAPPFDGEFRRIYLRDLALVDEYAYKLENNPTVRRCALEGGLLIGRLSDGFALCIYDRSGSFKDWKLLGFDGCKQGRSGEVYGIMKIGKEKPYENTKEKLDGNGA